jgi:hypothetical protein
MRILSTLSRVGNHGRHLVGNLVGNVAGDFERDFEGILKGNFVTRWKGERDLHGVLWGKAEEFWASRSGRDTASRAEKLEREFRGDSQPIFVKVVEEKEQNHGGKRKNESRVSSQAGISRIKRRLRTF